MKLLIPILLLGFALMGALGEDEINGCWKTAFGRGVGQPISDCPGGTEKDGGLCYPVCKDGYHGVGPVCWEVCPSGYPDMGVSCAKPPPYGRGGGYVIWAKDQCERENPQGCEQYGAMWYPKCRGGFHAEGCCICSPDCVDGMPDAGAFCTKQSYGRGAGQPMVCASGLQYDAGLCYKPCRSDHDGVGPLCWARCPNDYTHTCGALCLQKDECDEKMLALAMQVLEKIAEIAINIMDGDEEGAIEAVLEAIKEVSEDLPKTICGH